MPSLVEKDNCCGCSACMNICPKQAISMVADNTGFLFPQIDYDKCIDCKLCEHVCPGLSPLRYKREFKPLAYIVQNKDEKIRKESTSGGAFSAIASYIIQKNGVVFGAVLDDDLQVRHTYVEDLNGLERFRNSKYVQSIIGDSFKLVKNFLQSGRLVCFSGTPCQINGLHKYLKKEYSNLITVDITCKSIPSPLIFRKYVEFRKAKDEKISYIVFRDKKRGYSYSTLACYENSLSKKNYESRYRAGSESDEWLRLFLKGYCNRKSCDHCSYQNIDRVSDFTIWDCWEPKAYNKTWDNRGTTNMVIWSEKGYEIFQDIATEIRYFKYPFEDAMKGVVRKSKKVSKLSDSDREVFYKDANTLDAFQFFNKYAPATFKIKLKKFLREFFWRVKIYDLIYKIKFMIHPHEHSR